MTDDDLLLSPDDIERDLEGARQAEARIAAFFRRGEGGLVRTRGAAPAPPPPQPLDGVGRRLVARCSADTQRRYRTLLHFENSMPADGDYGTLIGPACNILESELRRLLAT